jgi:Fe-S cluster biogenesis protein NfuA
MIYAINKIIDEKIRPQLKEHNGDIKLIEVKDGIVRVKLLGACSNCPSSQLTVEQLIEVKLKEEISDIKKVIVDNAVSDDLIEMAKKLLNH